MANLKIATSVRNSMMGTITTAAGANAVLKLYSGSQPAGGGAEGTILSTHTCNTTFAPAASGGVLTLNSIGDATAGNSGTATWFRIETSGGTWVLDGDVSTVAAGSGDLTMDDTSIVANGTVTISGPNTLTAPNAA